MKWNLPRISRPEWLEEVSAVAEKTAREWDLLRTRLLLVLEQFPDARRAVVEAFHGAGM